MDSFIPAGGIQLPFQRRLSRLYNDTKKSSDFVKEPVRNAEDPDIKALHRKLRIQKDRLVSWGLEWSDPSQSAEILIDSSLSKAGLSEVVGSIMSTIKDILAEAEPLWTSSRSLTGSSGYDSQKGRDQKIQLVVWDKGRFEDLIRDLTTSIDTLYDLSRTRSSYAQSSEAARQRLFKSSSSVEDLRPFESTRMQTPQQIDPKTLTNLRSMQAEPMTELVEKERLREVVFMSKQAFADLSRLSSSKRTSGRQAYSPLLLEYAPFDPIYSTTGILPPMTRFEKLSAGLQAEPQRAPGSWSGLPGLLGYFEDMENSRFGMIYHFPATFNPISFEHMTQNPLYNLCSLADLLARPDFEPKLEAKFRLAANLANTVFDMHARGINHGNLVDTNVSFCNAVGTDPGVSGMSTGEVDIRRPLISSFDLFSDTDSQDVPGGRSLYKHPLDPRATAQSPLAGNAESKTFDLYSLAMVLLSIGLWTNLENLIADPSQPAISESVLEQLAIRCGTLYMKAVQTCWNAVDQEMTGSLASDQIVARVQVKASRYLEACCILDGVSNLEDRLSNDLGESRPEQSHLSAAPVPGPSKDAKSTRSLASSTRTSLIQERQDPNPGNQHRQRDMTKSQIEARDKSQVGAGEATAKMRLYPQVPVPPEAVEQWNNVVMPQINMALHHFYRKHPESVEISLESIGESPQRTQPTVLVVCTSVNKVRSILKRKLGILFDGTTGFSLKVCRGQVLRSRNRGSARSMAKTTDTDETQAVVAVNPGFQERPQNGASIGAWIGDRHLPPVSFGGLIMVDDKPYGMTVHHMLDDPDLDQPTLASKHGVTRSMANPESHVPDLAAWYAEQYQIAPETALDSDADSSESEDYACEFSDSDADAYSESAITSEASDDELDVEDDQAGEAGDIPGIEPGCGEKYIVTQPALDDVEEGFYPSPETQDEDHLDSYSLGEVYASSGIRRRSENGLVHEIDWALFEFEDERQPNDNFIPPVRSSADVEKSDDKQISPASPGEHPLRPTAVAPTQSLPGLEVQCMARTSGLQTGRILPTLTSVKIYGRKSPSHTYQISGTSSNSGSVDNSINGKRPLPMGMPGDSGAWIVDRRHGQLCGHVLAWSERKRVAYICPMDVLLKDIVETLDAVEIRLPGGDAVATGQAFFNPRASRITDISEDWEAGDEDEDAPGLASQVARNRSHASRGSRRKSYRTKIASAGGGDNVSSDEGVDVDVTAEIKRLQLGGSSEMRTSRLPIR